MLSQDEHEYGVSSYHRGVVSNMKNALNLNDGARDALLGNIQKYLTSEVLISQKNQRFVADNKTSELRKEMVRRGSLDVGAMSVGGHSGKHARSNSRNAAASP